MPSKYSKHMRRGGMQKAFSPLAAAAEVEAPEGAPVNLNEERSLTEKTLANVENAFQEIIKNIDGREYVYYILGPITQFDRELIKKLLDKGITVHAFIQGGIENFPKPPPEWATSLLGLVPANAGMDFENFYGFFEEDAHPNLHVYVQFTNMAKPLSPPGELILHKLWKESNPNMKKFLDDLEENERGHLFAKLWAFYNRTSAGGPWQHDPIEVINSLGALVGEGLKNGYYKNMVMSGRCVRYDKMHPDGVVFQNETVASIETNLNAYKPYVHSEAYDMSELAVPYTTSINADRQKRQKGVLSAINTGSRLPVEEGQFNNANYKGGANGIDKNTIIARLLDHIPPNKTKEEFDECQKYRFNQFNKLLRKSFGLQSLPLDSDDFFVEKMIKRFKSKFYAGVSIEILDPDNLFAAQLVKEISDKCIVFVHHQFYPNDVEIKCKDTPLPSVVSLMEIPEKTIVELLGNKDEGIPAKLNIEGIKPAELKLIGVENPQKYYALFPLLELGLEYEPGTKFQPKMLMYSQYYGEHKQPHMDYSVAELNFMKYLFPKLLVMDGQPLYGYKDTDYTFTATNLAFPVTQMNINYFFEKGLKKIEFVNKVVRELANTTAMHKRRQAIVKGWEGITTRFFRPTTALARRGGYNKSRK
jgi:hypothetical protein